MHLPSTRRARRLKAGLACLLVGSGLATVLVAPGLPARAVETTGATTIVSGGASGEANVTGKAVSDDGRWVAFTAVDSSGRRAVFVGDRRGGGLRTVSINSDGVPADANSVLPVLSGTGRFVLFTSDAQNLDGAADVSQVFVHDRDADGDAVFDEDEPGALRTTRVSVDSAGAPADHQAIAGDISDDGRIVVLDSGADFGLGANPGNDAFVHDRDADGDGIFDEAGGISTASLNMSSAGVRGNSTSTTPVVSADGRHAAFTSQSTDLVADDGNETADVFVRDLQAGTTVRVSFGGNDSELRWDAGSPSISATGRHVAFTTIGHVLVRDRDTDGNGVFDEPDGAATVPLTVNSRTVPLEAPPSGAPAISADGRFVAFESRSNDLVEGDTNDCTVTAAPPAPDPSPREGSHPDPSAPPGPTTATTAPRSPNCNDILLFDRDPAGDGLDGPDIRTEVVSRTADGRQITDDSFNPSIAGDGSVVVFQTRFPLTGDDSDGQSDVFARNRAVRPGDAVTTGAAASPSDPYQATVTTPSGGFVSMIERPSGPAPAGYSLLGSGFDIEAPAETVARPLRLTFRLDATVVPVQPPLAGLAVFRNGTEVPPCSGPPGDAAPDPCVDERVIRADGDAQITILSSHASAWDLGIPAATSLMSTGDEVVDGTASTGRHGMSDNGRWVAFEADDTSGVRSVFVRDRNSDTVRRASIASDGSPADDASTRAVISGTGRFVLFSSLAGNLDGLSGAVGAFVHDRDTDADGVFDEPGAISTVRVGVDSAGTPAAGDTTGHDISDDGRIVVLESVADLAPSSIPPDEEEDERDTDAAQPLDAFVHNRDTDGDGILDEPGAVSTTRLHVLSDDNPLNEVSMAPTITPDGRSVAFFSNGELTGEFDFEDLSVFVRDLVTGATTRLGRYSTSGWVDDYPDPPTISADGRHVAFVETQEDRTVVLHDRDTDGDGIFDEPGATSAQGFDLKSDGEPLDGTARAGRHQRQRPLRDVRVPGQDLLARLGPGHGLLLPLRVGPRPRPGR